MTLQQIKDTILHIQKSNTTNSVLYFLLKDKDNLYVKKADLEQDAQNELNQKEREELVEPFSSPELKLKDLTTSDERRDIIYLYNLDQIPEELEYLRSVLKPGVKFDLFDKKRDSLANLKAMVIAIGDEKTAVSVYKYHFPTNTYSTKGLSIFNAQTGTSRFEKLDKEVIRVGRGYEFINVAGNIYVANLKILEKFFGYNESTKKTASENLKKLADRNIIEKIDALANRISELGDMTFARKVIRALSHSPVIEKVTNQQILNFVANHHLLGRHIKLNATKDRMVLDTKTSQNFFYETA